VTVKTPAKTRRQGAATKARPKAAAATRKTRDAPAGVTARQKPKRKARG
jgi:hypothetical protein